MVRKRKSAAPAASSIPAESAVVVEPVETPVEETPAANVTPPPAPSAELRLEEDGGLPLPEGVEPSRPEVELPKLRVEPVDTAPIPVGVADTLPEARTTKSAGDASGMVVIRALRTADPAPNIGSFTFATAAGREARTNAVIRGAFVEGYRYRVPRSVANALIERDWAMIDE